MNRFWKKFKNVDFWHENVNFPDFGQNKNFSRLLNHNFEKNSNYEKKNMLQ